MDKGLITIIRGLLKHKQIQVKWLGNSPDDVKGILAFNDALLTIDEFLASYSEGGVSLEYINKLKELAQE